LTMLIVGGMSTVSGALAGTVVVTLTIELLRRLESGVTVFGHQMPEIFGLTQAGLCLLILAVMYWRPIGLIGRLEVDQWLSLGRCWPRSGFPPMPPGRPARSTMARSGGWRSPARWH